jgi:opacity protein-like surface antigen
MPLRHLVALFSLAVLAAPALRAEDPPPEAPKRHFHWSTKNDGTFAWQAQLNLPAKELGQALDDRSGLGLGVQWNHDRKHGHVARTRIEWNVFPEGHPVGLGAVKTKASNYVLSFDRLYHFSGEVKGAYALGGLGAVRWFTDRTAGPGPTRSDHATKLGVTAGAGYRFSAAFSLEARYLLSNVSPNFDGNMLQAAVNLRF